MKDKKIDMVPRLKIFSKKGDGCKEEQDDRVPRLMLIKEKEVKIWQIIMIFALCLGSLLPGLRYFF